MVTGRERRPQTQVGSYPGQKGGEDEREVTQVTKEIHKASARRVGRREGDH